MSVSPAPRHAVWLSEPSSAAIEMASLAGYDTIVLDVEHGTFDLGALDWVLPLIRARKMEAIVKVLGPERGPIQQALDLGASAVAVPHVESAAHAAEVTAFAKFPPLGLRSFAGGRTSHYRGFTDAWVTEQDSTTRCFPMIEDASAYDEIEEILALPTVDGVFIGPSDLSLLRGRGAYSVSDADLDDLRTIARAARAAGKPWILPAWSDAEKRLAVQEGAETIIGVMQYGAMLTGFTAALDTMRTIENEEGNA
ncbi:4-hydroxy-2-oxovalerate aldolase [Aeromicrobium phragmitis]|uniref:4-hydroxy-2-oxovalerate aldolase n=1 Tax=Aeromicrobium phragmitis TaxID=2478914 RepID=A0A3L8PSE7_9ACTN|nr:4-hydroxy-2-oxovalerate aldolase [Aeromicrobium phragmitis]